MARNGSGTFSRNYDFTADRDAGSPSNIISADKVDTEFDDIATALTASIAKDGQTTPSADLPMGGFKHTGVATAAPSARTQYVPVSGLQDSLSVFADGGGTVSAITAAISPAPSALVNGMRFRVRATGANSSTTPTFTPNSGTITAKTIVKGANSALAVGDIVGDEHEIDLVYNSTLDKWVLLNPTIGALGSDTVFNGGGVLKTKLVRNAQIGTTYTMNTDDRGKHVTFSNASAIAVTQPQSGSAGFTNDWFSYVENIGAGLVTITPTTSTINGAATLVLQTDEAFLITSDGTNYRALSMGRSTIAETDFDAANDTLSMYDTSTTSRKSVTGQILFNSVADVATDASPATGDFVLANDVSASNVAVKQTHASIQTLFAASQAQQETGTSTAVNVTPGRQHFHASACKAWVNFQTRGTNAACTINASYNVSGVSRTASGIYQVTFTNALSSANYAVVGMSKAGLASNLLTTYDNPATTTCEIIQQSASAGTATNTGDITATFFGDL